jgi:tetratricopeptide (TPR) repeat protein
VANLRFHVGDNQAALALALEAFADADKTNNKPRLLDTLLIITRLTEEARYHEQALALADKLKMNRERKIISFNILEVLLTRGKINKTQSLAKTLVLELTNTSNDLEYARFCNIAAELALKDNQQERSLDYADKAGATAEKYGLLPELLESHLLLGRIKKVSGEYEQCYQHYRKALGLSKKLAENTEDENDRRFFENKRAVQFLIKEIKDFGRVLTQ